ncbi:MAG: aminotransferase class I/II-fold pyridoxal phosphate-dependent enzyme [Gammaproteobacteria bacterium]|nr:aminotransferase class I/II-fold pyridoxal phosphate-dependent enzyme [Gammaproteobacteria bacterium]
MKTTRTKVVLDIDLSDPVPIPEKAIDEAVVLMRTGRLHRYGEFTRSEPHVALFEEEFASYLGSKYAVAVNSGGAALFLALKVANIGPGDNVLVNAFNLAPVPGAIDHVGAKPVPVETCRDFLINLDDLERLAFETCAKALLLTHMRGHIANMQDVIRICEQSGLLLIEDCAHTIGAKWNGQFTGRFGQLGCFSSQTYKHINSGEGGILITDDADMAARAILYSGSYMFYEQHRSIPPVEVFERWKNQIPNYSMRMSNLSACLVRDQLNQIPERTRKWNKRYRWLESRLNQISGIAVPPRDPREEFVGSSIQFHLNLDPEKIDRIVDQCGKRKVTIKWFGRKHPVGYTSQYFHWEYMGPFSLDDTSKTLSTTCDMRIPLALTEQHADTIAEIISEEIELAT